MTGRRYDVIYFNTAVGAADVTVLAEHADSVLWHIHELEYALRLAGGEGCIEELFGLAKRFITVSLSVSSTLVSKFKVSPERIDLIYGFVPIPKQGAEEAAANRRRIRRELGWPDQAFVVGGCGALGWRKGTDVFLQVAHRMCGRQDNDLTRFLWVGGGTGGDEVLRFEHDVRIFGLGNRCKLIPTTASVLDYYSAMDVFALTSREDPYPLVMLEAAACNLPVVCFDSAGGAPEFVAGDAGLVAPYLDMAALVSHLETLRASAELRRKLGAAAAEKVRTHHTVDVQGPRVLESINRCLSGMPSELKATA